MNYLVDGSEYLDIKQVAKLLDCSTTSAGDLMPTPDKKSGKKRLYLKTRVEAVKIQHDHDKKFRTSHGGRRLRSKKRRARDDPHGVMSPPDKHRGRF